MNRTLTTAATAVVLAASLVACSNSKPASSTGNPGKTTKPAAASSQPPTASTAFTQLAAKVSAAKLSGTVTADKDPAHLLGRPGQYTSKVTFTDSRIKTSDVEGTQPGDVDRGGAVEVFGSPADAQARVKYIQTVTKSLPMLAEYDYVHGTVVVRVSHYLTPTQAGQYKAAADGIG